MPPRKKATEAPMTATQAAHIMAPEQSGTITTHQMRELHALLRDHGMTGDTAVHAYIRRALVEAGDEPVESRSDLTATQAAHLIADLSSAEVVAVAGTAALKALRRPFGQHEVGKLPRSTCRDCSQAKNKRCDRHTWVTGCRDCGNSHTSATIHIDYVGHADVTARLLEVDPAWSYDFVAQDPNGWPVTDRNGGLWINLTVLGVTRPGYGDPGKNNGKPEGTKEAIGDALRNAAMRFGVALDLWAKGDRDWSMAEKVGAEDMHPDSAQPAQQQAPPRPWTGPSTADLLLHIDADAQRAGVTYEQATAKFIAGRGITLDAMDSLHPQELLPLRDAVRKRADEVVAAASAEAEAAAVASVASPAAEAANAAAAADPWAKPDAEDTPMIPAPPAADPWAKS